MPWTQETLDKALHAALAVLEKQKDELRDTNPALSRYQDLSLFVLMDYLN